MEAALENLQISEREDAAKACIFLAGWKEGENVYVTADTLAALFTLQYCVNPAINVVIVDQKYADHVWFPVDPAVLSFTFTYMKEIDCPYMIKSCLLPAVLSSSENWCIAGLCSSLRFVLQKTVEEFPNHYCQNLLGFRGGCLQACAEVSVWTKFCEIEIIKTLEEFSCWCKANDSSLLFPRDIIRFEYHMQYPPILHNALKRKQAVIKETVADKAQKQMLLMKKLSDLPDLEHNFAEGLDMTLADILLYASFHILLSQLNKWISCNGVCPLVERWYKLLSENEHVKNALPVLERTLSSFANVHEEKEIIFPDVPRESLYKSDPERYKPRWRAFTHQQDIDRVLEAVEKTNVDDEYNTHPCFENVRLAWSSYPAAVNPQEGELPEKRLQRKCQQIENIVSSVQKLAKTGDVIVDFCAGGGHVGIVLAYCLPMCKILFVENRESSLIRAYERVNTLGLKNVCFFQSNLDYFTGSFDVGVCLHACGVATDLVLQKCISQKARFVCCPCCYGGVQANHVLDYPRSQLFQDVSISLKDYLILGHAADQTHGDSNPKTKQGQKCMRLIDRDRLAHAEACGYTTKLVLMEPMTCSPKNHLLIGLPKQ